jgi:two-component system, sensor histidine kinase RegB
MREVEALNFSWFLKLRWGAIAAELLVFFAGDRLMHVALPLAPMLLVVGVAVSTNLAGAFWARRRKSVPGSALAALMVLDSLLLTAMLFFIGGDSNPFAVLYLVNIALAAVLLPPKWTWGITALSLICGGLLFLGRSIAPESSRAASNDPLEWQLRELWLSFAVAAALLVYFIQRTVRMLRERERIAELARQAAERRGKLASLATLAAGAAHELATPLSTIAVAAKELERQLERGQGVSNAIGDARLIRQEVERCRTILSQLAADAGQSRGEPSEPSAVVELVESALGGLEERHRIKVDLDSSCKDATLTVPPRAFSQALKAVVRNAVQASRDGSPIVLRLRPDGETLRIEISDQGLGMSPEVLAHAGEPFFTTKQPGEGMGLGLFLTRSLLEQLGGRLELAPHSPRGTVATLVLPKASLAAGLSSFRFA